jgi:hypothetical protein
MGDAARPDGHDLIIAEGAPSESSLDFEAPLPPSGRHAIRVRRETDGADLPGSPFTFEPAGGTPGE